MTLADYVEAAILIEAANRPQEIAQVYTDWATIVANLKNLVGAQVPDEVIESLMNRFLDEGVAEVVQDQFAGDYYKLNYEQLVECRDRNLVDGSSLVFKYGLVGNQFLHNAIAKFSSDDFDISRPQVDQPGAQVPASDRVVSLDHNHPEYDEIASALDNAIELASNTRPNGVSGDEHASLVAGIRAARELWKAFELTKMQIEVGILMALEQVQKTLRVSFQSTRGNLLVEVIKEFVNVMKQIDL